MRKGFKINWFFKNERNKSCHVQKPKGLIPELFATSKEYGPKL